MIDVEINGTRETVSPDSVAELRRIVAGSLPSGEVICSLRVNGREHPESGLDEYDLRSIQNLEVKTETPERLARGALGETVDWISRIQSALDSIARDYRFGRDTRAADRLLEVLDVLQVLLGLLAGIRANLPPAARREEDWRDAEAKLLEAVKGFEADLKSRDGVRIADRIAYALPRALDRFRALLEDVER